MPRVTKWQSMTARDVGVYNTWDTVGTARLAKHLPLEIGQRGKPGYFEREVWPAVPAIIDMQRRGLAVDEIERTSLRVSLENELAETDAVIYEAAGGEINLGSWQQKSKLLFDRLGLRPAKLTKGGGQSTDLEALATVLNGLRKMDEHAVPVLHALFHRSRINTLLTRYLNFPTVDGIVYPQIKFCGTKTERLAYALPPLQQWPQEIRGCIVARPGHLLVSADHSQLEARILAIHCHDTASLEAFARGEDIHRSNARDLFITFDSMVAAAMDAARNFAKSFLYGISYGGQAETMKAKTYCPCPKCVLKSPPTMKLSRLEMRRIADRWFARHKPVLEFRDHLADQIRRFHYWESPLGGRRWIFAPWKEAEREVYNLPEQWCAAQIVRREMVRLLAREAPLLLNMHDSLTLEVPEGAAEDWGKLLKEEMEQPVPELDNTVFPVKVTIAERWSELH